MRRVRDAGEFHQRNAVSLYKGAALAVDSQNERQRSACAERRRLIDEPFALPSVDLGGETMELHVLPGSCRSEIAVSDAQPSLEAEHELCHAAVFFGGFGLL